MAITLVGTAQIGAVADGNDVTLTFDGTPAEGDTVYVFGGRADTDGNVPGPSTSGYTEVHLTQSVESTGVWRKRLGATPDSEVVCRGSGGTQDTTVYGCFVLRGVDETTPEDADPTVTVGTSGNVDNPAITTVTDGAWVLAVASNSHSSLPGSTITGYSNFVEATEADTDQYAAFGATKEVTTAGTEDPEAWDASSNNEHVAITVAVRPDSGEDFDPAGFEATVDGSDVSLSWDSSF